MFNITYHKNNVSRINDEISSHFRDNSIYQSDCKHPVLEHVEKNRHSSTDDDESLVSMKSSLKISQKNKTWHIKMFELDRSSGGKLVLCLKDFLTV